MGPPQRPEGEPGEQEEGGRTEDGEHQDGEALDAPGRGPSARRHQAEGEGEKMTTANHFPRADSRKAAEASAGTSLAFRSSTERALPAERHSAAVGGGVASPPRVRRKREYAATDRAKKTTENQIPSVGPVKKM